jgi:hypothetical protein
MTYELVKAKNLNERCFSELEKRKEICNLPNNLRRRNSFLAENMFVGKKNNNSSCQSHASYYFFPSHMESRMPFYAR